MYKINSSQIVIDERQELTIEQMSYVLNKMEKETKVIFIGEDISEEYEEKWD